MRFWNITMCNLSLVVSVPSYASEVISGNSIYLLRKIPRWSSEILHGRYGTIPCCRDKWFTPDLVPKLVVLLKTFPKPSSAHIVFLLQWWSYPKFGSSRHVQQPLPLVIAMFHVETLLSIIRLRSDVSKDMVTLCFCGPHSRSWQSSQHTKNVTPRQQRVPRKAKAAKAKAKVKAKPKKKGSQTKRDENGGLLI